MTTPAADFTIYIVEDDASVRDALGLLLGLRGYRTAIFADAESFLQAWRADWHGCLLLDIRMPGMDGLTLQRRLLDLGCRLPAIVMSGHGDVGSARDAFKSQAVDFLEKPLDHGRLLAAIEEAGQRLTATQREQAHDARRDAFAERLAALTPRERRPPQPRDRRGARHQRAHGRGAQGADDAEAARRRPAAADPPEPRAYGRSALKKRRDRARRRCVG